MAPQSKGIIDLFMIKKPNVKDARLRQTSINDACAKEARDRTFNTLLDFFLRSWNCIQRCKFKRCKFKLFIQ